MMQNISIKSIHKIGLIILCAFFTSCEDTGCIYEDERFCDPAFDMEVYEGLVPFAEDLSDYQQRHLLEEFTGFLCTNCPAATSTANNLKNEYPDRLSLIGIHCSFIFAAPLTTDPNEPFYLDMRTENGETYYSTFTNEGPLPNGIIDRNVPTLAPSQWEERITELMANNNPQVFIKIDDVKPSADSSQIVAKVLVKPLEMPTEFTRYTLNMALIENGIHEAQKDVNNIVIEDYVHQHVFRANSNGPWGIFAFDSEQEVPENQAMEFTLTIPVEADWVLENCEVLVYVSTENTHEIIQIEETAIAE